MFQNLIEIFNGFEKYKTSFAKLILKIHIFLLRMMIIGIVKLFNIVINDYLNDLNDENEYNYSGVLNLVNLIKIWGWLEGF